MLKNKIIKYIYLLLVIIKEIFYILKINININYIF